jgi:2-polyprenyl-3-methyl-5-hydroxy-6-metoxy-1,4-benzoquinol methylase
MAQGSPNFNVNDTFFKSSFKEVWRKLIPQGLTEAEVDFIQQIAGLEAYDHVLDIMCGYGRHSLGLARRGMKVTAVDNLPEYIEELTSLAEKENFIIDSLLENVTKMKIDKTFDAAICMGNSLCFFQKSELQSILSNLTALIKPGGFLIVNTLILETVISQFESKSWMIVDEFKYLLDNKYLFNPTRIEAEHTLIKEDGEMQILKGIDYIFSFAELKALLEEAGFQNVEIYATPRKKKFQVGDKNSYIVSKRKH